MPLELRLSPSRPAPPGMARLLPERSSGSGFVVIHPRYAAAFARWGLANPQDFLDLPGVIVSGHPDRHVLRVELPEVLGEGGVAYLKRQHRVSWRERWQNRWAGFGPVSRSVREAQVLQWLEEARILAPEWLAYGESVEGRAFLLVADLAPAVELRHLLSDPETGPEKRRNTADAIGRYLAQLHVQGIHHPETVAKHAFLHPETLAVAFLDWQGAKRGRKVSAADAARSFAVLHASLASGLADARDRLRVYRAYRTECEQNGRDPRQIPTLKQIRRVARAVWERRSIRDQRLARSGVGDQRLLWLAGEAVCVIPELAGDWPKPADGPPFYPPVGRSDEPELVRLILRAGQQAWLVRRLTPRRWSRWLDRFRTRPWRSPELQAARILFHLARHGIPAPRLLAFGQKQRPDGDWQSFLLFQPLVHARPLADWLGKSPPAERQRRALNLAGLLLRELHRAGCRLNPNPLVGPLLLVNPTQSLHLLTLGDPYAIMMTRPLSRREALHDLSLLAQHHLPGLSNEGYRWLLEGYLGEPTDDA